MPAQSRRRRSPKNMSPPSTPTTRKASTTAHSRHSYTREDTDEVELNLLSEEQRAAAYPNGRAEDELLEKGNKQPAPLTARDKSGIALLILLCMYLQ